MCSGFTQKVYSRLCSTCTAIPRVTNTHKGPVFVLIKVSGETDARPPEAARRPGSEHLWAGPGGAGQSERDPPRHGSPP